MAKLILSGDTSGSVTLESPAVSGTTTLTLPTTSATLLTDSSGVLNIGSGQLYKDASGNVGIGTTTISTGYISGNGSFTLQNAKSIAFNNSSNTWSTTTTGGAITYFTDNNLYIDAKDSTSNILFRVNNATERMRIGSTGYVTNAVNGLGNGIVQAQQYYRLNSTVVGANATGAQSIFGVGVTLIGSTQYEFEAVYMLSRSAGTTAHTMAFGFGGTATINNIGYTYAGGINGAASSGPASVATLGYTNTATLTTATSGAASAPGFSTVIIKGTVSVNAGGTFIPQYSLSAAPGGAYTTQIGSYFKIAPLAASGANVSIGSWA